MAEVKLVGTHRVELFGLNVRDNLGGHAVAVCHGCDWATANMTAVTAYDLARDHMENPERLPLLAPERQGDGVNTSRRLQSIVVRDDRRPLWQ